MAANRSAVEPGAAWGALLLIELFTPMPRHLTEHQNIGLPLSLPGILDR